MSEWMPLQRATHLNIPKAAQDLIDAHPELQDEITGVEHWVNDVYQVAKRLLDDDGNGKQSFHLSIKRTDRKPCRDWRDFQRIKTELCGADAEGMELYPAESRVVDAANQYHLWVFTGVEIPAGFPAGLRATKEEAATLGATQREE